MKKIEVTVDALERISSLRSGEEYEIMKSDIADSLSSLARMIEAGRDEEAIHVWTDDLLKVMYVLGEYNDMVNAICNTSDRVSGFYMYEDSERLKR